MNKLEEVVGDARGTRTLFMAHMIAGFPTRAASRTIAKALVDGGADLLEIQIPFSDPMADGPTIAVASEDALRRGMTVREALAVVQDAAKFGAPIAVMTYLNPVFRMGIETFVKTCARVGASALIVPDCPFDSPEGVALVRACRTHDISPILVVTPGVPEERLDQLLRDARGFIYCTSRQGITGANSRFATTLPRFLARLRTKTHVPIAVGFGVKRRADVRAMAPHADIIVAGSTFVATARAVPLPKLYMTIAAQTRALIA